MDLELHDKVVLVTGGARGIGAAIVRAAVQEGAKVMIVDRSLADHAHPPATLEPGTAAIECGRLTATLLAAGRTRARQPVPAPGRALS